MIKRIFLVGAALVLALLVASGPSTSALAAPGIDDKEIPTTIFPMDAGMQLLAPIQESLSGSTWTMLEQLGPSLQGGSQNQGIGVGVVPYRNPAPAFSRNLVISRDWGIPIQTEPDLALNPNDPDHLIMATIDYALPYTPVYVTFDRGEHWQISNPVPLTKDTFRAADPVVAIDRSGRAYLAYMSIGSESYSLGPFIITLPKSDIAVSASDDGGINWAQPTVVNTTRVADNLQLDDQGKMRGFLQFSFLDKPWMAVGPDPNDLSRDIIYVTYTAFVQTYTITYIGEVAFLQFAQTNTTIVVGRSTDGAKSWSDINAVSPVAQGIIIENPNVAISKLNVHAVQGSQPVVADDGTAYVFWYDSTLDGFAKDKAELYMAKSTNGGVEWSEPSLVVQFNEGPRFSNSASFRNSYFPSAAVGPNGELYVVYPGVPQDKSTDHGDVYIVISLNQGVDWSEPVRLNQDDTNQLQFFPTVTTDKAGGVHVMWGDMRDHPTGLKYHIYYTRSLDRGLTWGFKLPGQSIREPSTRVTDFPSNPNKGFPRGRFIGDYMAIAAGDDETQVYMVWPDTRLGEFGPVNQKIGFARREAIASPEVFLNPARGPGGQEVTIQAFNFQPNLEIVARVGGIFVSLGRTNDNGEVSKNVFLPIASQGAHEVTLFDESGNVATSSFFMDFGFGDLQKFSDELQAATELNASLAGSQQEIREVQQDMRTMQLLTFVTVLLMSSVVVVAAGWVFFKRRRTS